jgi:hypothetical protein
MLSASCFFRGNYMIAEAAEKLLRNLCSFPELVPEFWNILEPINVPFQHDKAQATIAAMTPISSKTIRSLVFFVRKKKPRFRLSIDLRLAPFQWTTPHNSIRFDKCALNEHVLAQYLSTSVLPDYPDYASIPDWTTEKERYDELKRSYSPKEFVERLSKRSVTTPLGPYGCLADIHWFNYFGKIYVEAIGRERLKTAGWSRIEETGGGLACYSTEKLDEKNSRERRDRIAKALEEFVWTPGCKPHEKKIPDFDFSEQYSALSPDILIKVLQGPAATHVSLAGFSDPEVREVAVVLGKARGGSNSSQKTGD